MGGSAAADPVPPGGAASDRPLPEMAGVKVTEKLGGQLPLDLMFTDETGAPIRLGSLFGDGKPIILTFNYSACPGLCSTQLGNLVYALDKMEGSAGQEFRIITIGINPMESHQRAMATKLRYLERYRRETADEGWRFLTGTDANIHAVAAAAGFGYRLNTTTGDFLHPAALILVSPQGTISTYVYGVEYDAKQLGVLLGGAKRGVKAESPNQFLLACYHYEAKKGAAAFALELMQLGGLATIGAILAVFGTRALRARARKRRARELTPEST
ncbi:MAG TPA: SCO family protein [Kofleriaceae bacterium]|nr:SCO family protein [Kofleriaceae bacterium]